MRLYKRQRLVLALVALLLLGGATTLVLTAMGESIAYFATPTEVSERQVEPGRRLRIGGLVVDGSVVRGADGTVQFRLTDTNAEVPVAYKGLLPDLFREGQGIVAQGAVDGGGVFMADEVLAKHDERYMPKEVADSLKAQGVWNEGQIEASKGSGS